MIVVFLLLGIIHYLSNYISTYINVHVHVLDYLSIIVDRADF
jgi:hypothetical protein